jgi:hypothetical protein
LRGGLDAAVDPEDADWPQSVQAFAGRGSIFRIHGRGASASAAPSAPEGIAAPPKPIVLYYSGIATVAPPAINLVTFLLGGTRSEIGLDVLSTRAQLYRLGEKPFSWSISDFSFLRFSLSRTVFYESVCDGCC